jgi:uncharacterized membrane protein YccC
MTTELGRTLGGHMAEVFRFAPVRPAIMLGIRAALATALPLVVGLELGSTSSLWGILGGYNATLADKGGAYPSRALAMGAITFGCAASAVLGGLIADHAFLTVPGMLIFATLCSLAAVYGDAPARIGSSIAVVFAISLASPMHTLDAAFLRGVWIVGGGLWAMFLGLALWPVRVYQPVRRAIATCYESLAAHAHSIATAMGRSGDWRSEAVAQHGRLRQDIEVARAVLQATRRGRRSESGRGARLHVLLEIADEIFGHLTAFTNVAGSARTATTLDAIRAESAAALDELGDRLAGLAPRIRTEGRLDPVPPPNFRAEAAIAELDRLDVPPVVADEHRHIIELLRLLHDAVSSAQVISTTLLDDAPLPEGVPPVGMGEHSRGFLEPIRQNLTFDSMALRHAARVGVTAALATALTHALALERGYWVTLTVILLLQPHAPATMTRTVQRVVGTLVGGLLAAGISQVLHDPVIVLTVVLALAAVSTAVLAMNYALFATLLTPTFVLLAEVSGGGWRLAGVRVENTIIGGALALASAWLLWPSWERDRFAGRMTEVFTALRAYAIAVRTGLDAGGLTAPAVVAARRKMGLTLNNAEASFERVLAERPRTSLEPLMTLVFYARRVGSALSALASARSSMAAATLPAMEPVWRELDGALADLEEATRTGRPAPARRPVEDLAQVPELARTRIDRLLEELEVLRRAAARWLAPGDATSISLAPAPSAGP